MIAVIDYDAGNIKSVIKAVEHLGGTVRLTRDREEILSADHIILPGVGNFGDCMEKLRGYDLEDVVHEAVGRNIPFLGICLGLQLLFEDSEEALGVRGLAVLDGHVRRIPDGEGRKVPNIGWCSLEYQNDGRVFKPVSGEDEDVYFVHSYYLQAEDESIVKAVTDYGVHIHAAVESGNVFGCQFHPEKSSLVGLEMLKRFLEV